MTLLVLLQPSSVAYSVSPTDTATLADVVAQAIGKAASDSVSTTETTAFSVSLSLSDTIVLIESLARSSSKPFSDSFSLSETFSSIVEEPAPPRPASDKFVDFADMKADALFVDPRADALFVDITAHATYALLSITELYLGGYPLPEQAYTDSASLADAYNLLLSKGITPDTLSFTENYNLVLNKGVAADTLPMADTYRGAFAKALAETTLLSDSAAVAVYNTSSVLNANIIGEFALNA